MRTILLIIALLALQACATSYQRSGFTGGYSETRLDQNVFRVSFKGNGFTSRDRVADFALLRSAELCLKHGYSYFAVVDANSYTSRSSYTTPTQSYTTGSAYSYGNYATGSATTTTTGGQTYNISKPGSSNTIACFEREPESFYTFDAAFISENIAKKYDIELQ